MPGNLPYNAFYFFHNRNAISNFRRFKYIPRIIHVICTTLLKLAGATSDLLSVLERVRPSANRRTYTSAGIDSSRSLMRLSFTESLSNYSSEPSASSLPSIPSSTPLKTPEKEKDPLNPDWEEEEVTLTHIAAYLLVSDLDGDELKLVDDYKMKLNQGPQAYKELEEETNPVVLACLLWSWLDHLKEPVLTSQDLFVLLNNKPTTGLLRLEQGTRSLLYYLLNFVSKLFPLPEEIEYHLILRLLSSLTYVNMFSQFDDLQDDRDDNATSSDQLNTSGEPSLSSAMFLSCPAHFTERRSKKEVAQLFNVFHQIIVKNFPCQSSCVSTSIVVTGDSLSRSVDATL